MYTLKPFLKKLQKTYPNKLDKIVADAGYESEENYVYLSEHKLYTIIFIFLMTSTPLLI